MAVAHELGEVIEAPAPETIVHWQVEGPPVLVLVSVMAAGSAATGTLLAFAGVKLAVIGFSLTVIVRWAVSPKLPPLTCS